MVDIKGRTAIDAYKTKGRPRIYIKNSKHSEKDSSFVSLARKKDLKATLFGASSRACLRPARIEAT